MLQPSRGGSVRTQSRSAGSRPCTSGRGRRCCGYRSRTGAPWLKACAPVQAFEPRLTADLFARWRDRAPEVLAYDEERAWLLLADAHRPRSRVRHNHPEAWLHALPLYAELQRGEVARVRDHLAHGVPDLRLVGLPARYEELLRLDLPLERDEVNRLRDFAPRFIELCDELAYDVPETIQHDDLHHANLYVHGGRMRVLDWGDASISHPFASLVVTFRFLEERTNLTPGRGSRGFVTHTSRRGARASAPRSPSPSVSAPSRARSHTSGCGPPCSRRNDLSSTPTSRSCCGARSPRRSRLASKGDEALGRGALRQHRLPR
jgi:hypothetical protein